MTGIVHQDFLLAEHQGFFGWFLVIVATKVQDSVGEQETNLACDVMAIFAGIFVCGIQANDDVPEHSFMFKRDEAFFSASQHFAVSVCRW